MKINRGLFSKYSITSHTFGDGVNDTIKTSESPTIEGVLAMSKKEFISDFKKLKFEKNYITIDLESSNDKVSIYIEKIYSDDFSECSKTFTQWLETKSKKTGRVIITRKRTYKNPEYDLNPECEFCYKKVIEVFKDHLLNKAKTEKMVCSKCKKDLANMRIILEKIEARKK